MSFRQYSVCFLFALYHDIKMRTTNLRDSLHNSSERSVCLQSLSFFSSSSSPATAASRPTSNRKSANASDLEVERLKQVGLHACLVSMFVAKKRCLIAARYRRWDCLEYSVKSAVRFFLFATFLLLKLQKTNVECVVNQPLQVLSTIIGNLIYKAQFCLSVCLFQLL